MRLPRSIQPRVVAGVVGVLALVLIAALLTAVFGAGRGNSPSSPPEINVERHATIEVATDTPQPRAAVASPVIVVTAGATSAPIPTEYIIQQDDTLWDIAVRYGLTIDALIGANPGLNPDRLQLGDRISIPPTDYIPPPRPTSTPGAAPSSLTTASVLPEAGGLRLRSGPGIDTAILTKLAPNSEVQLVGEVAGQTWVEVITPNGTHGYVMAQYLAINGATTLPTAAPGQAAPTAAPPPPATGPLDYPFLSELSPRVYEIYRAGQARGNRSNAFALVGDSNTANPAFFKPFDWGSYNLGNYPYLQPTIDYFKGSFVHDSPAARGGFNTKAVLGPSDCGDTALACELRNTRASVALIMLGTGDQHSWQTFESRYRQIIEYTINQGVIPVLITKADNLETRDNSAPLGFINQKIAQLAAEYQVPLLNLRQVVERLPGGGCIADGFHYNFPPDLKSAVFTPEYLQYGYNQYNLTALQTLDVIRRKVMGG